MGGGIIGGAPDDGGAGAPICIGMEDPIGGGTGGGSIEAPDGMPGG